MIASAKIPPLVLIAILGHSMALFWILAAKFQFKLCQKPIYAIPISREQISREVRNSIHTPIHAILLCIFVLLGFFTNTTRWSFVISLFVTAVWAEAWHYVSHRIFHSPQLHWIHVEHHRSHLSSPFTALSFSFTEKLLFNLGILGFLGVVDRFHSLNFYGIAAWYTGYLVINSFSHANFEVKSQHFQRWAGRILTSTTYHALHHSRYANNYGLGTRIFDRIFGTEWSDYDSVFERVAGQGRPLSRLGEKTSTSSPS